MQLLGRFDMHGRIKYIPEEKVANNKMCREVEDGGE